MIKGEAFPGVHALPVVIIASDHLRLHFLWLLFPLQFPVPFPYYSMIELLLVCFLVFGAD